MQRDLLQCLFLQHIALGPMAETRVCALVLPLLFTEGHRFEGVRQLLPTIQTHFAGAAGTGEGAAQVAVPTAQDAIERSPQDAGHGASPGDSSLLFQALHEQFLL